MYVPTVAALRAPSDQMNEKNDQPDNHQDENISNKIGNGIPTDRLTEAINRREEKRIRLRGYCAQF